MDTRTNCGFADGWSKPHPYSEVLAKQQFVALLSETDKHHSKKEPSHGESSRTLLPRLASVTNYP